MQLMAITPHGMSAVQEWRRRIAVADEYERLRNDDNPQRRGRKLEPLLRTVVQNEGWEAEANVHAPGEENDLIIHQGREYYIVQCKWEKDPVQRSYFGDLRDRMTSRAGVRGVFVSLSGYTEEAVKDAIDRLETAILLLYGPEDVGRIMRGGTTFTALL
jgi:hypothetical protein